MEPGYEARADLETGGAQKTRVMRQGGVKKGLGKEGRTTD